MVKLTQGVIFINLLKHSFYAAKIPKAQKAAWLDCLFVLLESLLVKAARKMLVKLTQGVRRSECLLVLCFELGESFEEGTCLTCLRGLMRTNRHSSELRLGEEAKVMRKEASKSRDVSVVVVDLKWRRSVTSSNSEFNVVCEIRQTLVRSGVLDHVS